MDWINWIIDYGGYGLIFIFKQVLILKHKMGGSY